MADIVLVHGAWHGGWCWEQVANLLLAKGHRVLAPTLTGLAERAGPDAATVSLSTHCDDVVRAIHDAQLRDVVLCGHSYGGMVITGAAELLQGELGALIYVDAFLPAAEQSLCDIIGREFDASDMVPPPPIEMFGISKAADRERVQSMMTSHPANTMREPVGSVGGMIATPIKLYILAQDSAFPQFHEFYRQLSVDSAWRTAALMTGHHPMLDAPEELVTLIESTIVQVETKGNNTT